MELQAYRWEFERAGRDCDSGCIASGEARNESLVWIPTPMGDSGTAHKIESPGIAGDDGRGVGRG